MHAKCLQDIKLHSTDLLADFNQLKVMRAKGTPRQREAIDRLEPLLQSMTLASPNHQTTESASAQCEHAVIP